ncbi:type VII secretion protein EccE [Streptomyces sp. NPDC005438]|uniref:type VII secretion protein EccE n=1 Tax=Streptomyces sp. NPDC005438 TaxID=3156880 RepID=UPI0033AA3C2C
MQQLVLFQLALATLLVAAAVHRWLLVPALLVAAALVLFAVLRRNQRSLRDWYATRAELRARQRLAQGPPPSDVDPGLAPVAECVPGLRTHGYVDRDRRTVGMVGDGTFLTTVLRVEAKVSALRPPGGSRALPLRLLHDALEVDGIRLASVQVVQHVQPAPATHLPAQAVARTSYAPLQERCGAPAMRLMWVALRLDPELCPEAVEARGGGQEGAQRCLLRAADQLASRLVGSGFAATVLAEDELVAALATSACVNPLESARAAQPGSPSVRRTEESAQSWRCDDRLHSSYAVSGWPELGRAATPLPRLVSLITSTPTLTTTFSLTLGRGRLRNAVGVSGCVRVTARSPEELTQARRHLEHSARDAGVGLTRLDREQLPGVLATLPLGGTH